MLCNADIGPGHDTGAVRFGVAGRVGNVAVLAGPRLAAGAVQLQPDARAPNPPSDFVGMGLAATTRGLIAAGYSRSGPPFDGRVYRSIDGFDWEVVSGGDAFRGVFLHAVGEQGSSRVLLVAGTVVRAGGAGGAQSGTVEGAAWASVDLEHSFVTTVPEYNPPPCLE